MRRKILPYNPKLKEFARQLRNKSTRTEVTLWKYLRGKQMCGYDFHRQKPLLNFIADFYCYELRLVIELDGYTHQFEETIIKDAIKERELKKIGLIVLRFEDDEVMNDMENVLRTIECYVHDYQAKHTPNPSQEGN